MRLDLGDIRLDWTEDGSGPPVLLIHALGTGIAMWDAVMPFLPPGYRYIRYDLRGHGGSDVPPAPYAMGALIRDAERLLDALEVREAVVAGVSIGGMIAQGLAVKRLDLVRGLLLSNTAVKIGTPATWAARVAAIRAGGMAALAEDILTRWFPRPFRDGPEAAQWRAALAGTPAEGYIGGCQAIAGTDFYTPTAGLTLPTLVIAGSEDGSTPPDLVRETAGLIKGAEFRLLRRTGHVPPIDAPEAWADLLAGFLNRIGHGRGSAGPAAEGGAGCGCGHDHGPSCGHTH